MYSVASVCLSVCVCVKSSNLKNYWIWSIFVKFTADSPYILPRKWLTAHSRWRNFSCFGLLVYFHTVGCYRPHSEGRYTCIRTLSVGMLGLRLRWFARFRLQRLVMAADQHRSECSTSLDRSRVYESTQPTNDMLISLHFNC